METTWREIECKDLEKEKGNFIVITYWDGGDRNFLLARVISKNKIEEISESNTDRINFGNLKTYFLQHPAYSAKRELFTVGIELRAKLGSSTPATITDIRIIDKKLIEEMFKEKLEREKEKVKKMRDEVKSLKKNMKKLGFIC